MLNAGVIDNLQTWAIEAIHAVAVNYAEISRMRTS